MLQVDQFKMDNRCRTCLRMPDKLVYLFEIAQLTHKIETISDVKIVPEDNLPHLICEECIQNINLSFNFRKVIRNSDLELRECCAILNATGNNLEQPNGAIEDDVPIKEETDDDISSNVDSLDVNKINDNAIRTVAYFRRKIPECKSCKLTFDEYSKWKLHNRAVHLHRICNICGKSIRGDNLKKHIISHSVDPTPCSVCGKVCKNKESLRLHMIMHRTPATVCNLCGRTFKLRSEYNRHMKKHSLNGRKTVKCPLCDKMFSEKKSIKRHIQSHTGERPYECQYCHKGFSSPYARKTHIRQHTNEKPYICEYCSAAFPQKVSLVTHIKSKHSDGNV